MMVDFGENRNPCSVLNEVFFIKHKRIEWYNHFSHHKKIMMNLKYPENYSGMMGYSSRVGILYPYYITLH